MTHPGGTDPGVGHCGAKGTEPVWNIIFLNVDQIWTSRLFTVVIIATVAVGELLLDDSLLQARPDPADLSLDGETVVLQHGGGDEGAGGEHRAVTGLAALS